MKTKSQLKYFRHILKSLNESEGYCFTEQEMAELKDIGEFYLDYELRDCTPTQLARKVLDSAEFLPEKVFFDQYVEKKAVGMKENEKLEDIQGDRRADVLDAIDVEVARKFDVYDVRYLDGGRTILMAWL